MLGYVTPIHIVIQSLFHNTAELSEYKQIMIYLFTSLPKKE